MIVNKINIPSLMKDNDAAYLNHVEYTVRSIDNNAELTVIQKLNEIGFRIVPSDQSLKQIIIKSIRKAHYKLKIKIDFSKSINSTNLISFWTCFND